MGFGDEIPKRVLGRQPYRSPKRIHHQSESEAFEKHKIDIRQAGLNNKTDGTQLWLGVACFCTSKGRKTLVFCMIKQES
jgi:hypothetical protein